ncbi:MAG: hypothetical protein ACUVWW_02880 [Anaerolineae bacterium]
MKGSRTFAGLALTLSLVAALVAGCTAEGKPVILTGAGEAAGTVQAPQGLSGGSDQATPADMGRSPDEEVAEEEVPGAEEVVTSEGERIIVPSGEAGASAPGKVGSGAAPGEESQVREKGEVLWLVYRNEEFGFQVRYPSVYVLMPVLQTLEGGQAPRPLAEFLFQDQDLARGDTAAMEPPQFAIRVFANEEGLSVDQWLRRNDVLGAEEFQVEAYSLGGVEGVRLTSRLLLAPGQHIYVAKGRYVFQLTPLGEYSNQMLASFAFLD